MQMRRFDTLIDALNENKGDAAIASIAVTPETRARADFSDPYYRPVGRFAARRDARSPTCCRSAIEGKKIAVVGGTAHEQYLRALFTEADMQSLSGRGGGARALCSAARSICCSATAFSLAFWLNGTDSDNCCAFVGGPFMRKPLFRRRHRRRGQARQRHAASGVQLGAVSAVGERPLRRPVAAVFPDQSVLSLPIVA